MDDSFGPSGEVEMRPIAVPGHSPTGAGVAYDGMESPPREKASRKPSARRARSATAPTAGRDHSPRSASSQEGPSPARGVVDWHQADIQRWLAQEGLGSKVGALHGIDRGIELLAMTRADLSTLPHSPGSRFSVADLDRVWRALQRLRVRERSHIFMTLGDQGAEGGGVVPHTGTPEAEGIPAHVARQMPLEVADRLRTPASPLRERRQSGSEPEKHVGFAASCKTFADQHRPELFGLRHLLVATTVVLIILGFQSRPSEWRTLGRVHLRVHEVESAFKGDIYSVSPSRPLTLNLTKGLPSDFVTVWLFVPPVQYELGALVGNSTAGATPGRPPTVRVEIIHLHRNGSWMATGESFETQAHHSKPSSGKGRLRGSVRTDPDVIDTRLTLGVTQMARGRAAFSHIPLKVKVVQHPALVEHGPLLGAMILLMMYTLIMLELVPKTVAAMGASLCAVATVSYLQERPDLEELVAWIDIETIGLLFGMMVMVGLLSTTGFFEWAAAKGYRLSGGDTWRLVVILCIFTGVVSAILDNVTTVLLVAPVTLRLCKVLGVRPQPVLIAEVVFSNIGGALTPIGDPPNVIIANNDDVRAEGVTFFQFTAHMLGGVLMAGATTLWLLKRLLKNDLMKCDTQLQTLENELLFYESLVSDLAGTTTDILAPKMYFNQRIAEIEHEIALLKEADAGRHETPGTPLPTQGPSADQLEEMYKITDRTLLAQCGVVIGTVVLLFFLHSTIQLQISIAMISLLGAITLIAIADRSLESLLHKVEWPTLLFFASLFVLMRALEELELVEALTKAASSAVKGTPPGSQTTVAVLLVLWLSALVSAFIDNIPFTAAMVPVIANMAHDTDLNVKFPPLIWALAFGTCFGEVRAPLNPERPPNFLQCILPPWFPRHAAVGAGCHRVPAHRCTVLAP
eukprot:TRINITY_DN1853_c0_g1_i4.p1 TRINITY_DN1853_c0_g1~~TRINITY_DN1853_c0_g1_i4.p1  ORF type:complete len:914 (+),score=163.17 TRINITY_DN1853_c0_g1_i4:86-2827(+)